MPYPAATFERVLTSLTLHHLSSSHLDQTLREIRRVLAPGGELHIADFAGGHRQLGHLSSLLKWHQAEAEKVTSSQLAGRMAQAGFAGIEHHGDLTTLLGRISYFSGRKAK
jgi:ubiquinone/menaquinone biosynthesis C-methylase UbiE